MLNFFQTNTLKDLESYEYIEYFEEGGGSSQSQLIGRGNDLRIKMTDRDMISLPSDSFLDVRFQIQQSDGTAFNTGKIAPVNCGWNIFKRGKYLMNDEIVEDILRPGYVRQIKGLIEYSDDYEKGQGQNELWAPDRIQGGLTETIDIMVRNITQPTLPHYNLTLSAANPHILQVNGGAAALYADNDEIALYIMIGDVYYEIDTYISTAAIAYYTPVQLLSDGALGAAIDYAGIAADDGIHFFINGKELNFTGSVDYSNGSLTANATPDIVFNDGDNTASNASLEWGIINMGYEKRRMKGIDYGSHTGKSYDLQMPIRRLFQILKENPVLMKGLQYELEFELNDMKKILFRDANVDGPNDGSIVLQKLSWWIPIVKPKKLFELEFLKTLESGTIFDMTWSGSNHYYSQPRNEEESVWLVHTADHRPSRLVIFFQYDSKFNDQTENNMVFDHLDLGRIHVFINSDRQYPRREYVINYGESDAGNTDYSRVYTAYLNFCGATHSDDCTPAISYEDFKTLYPIYCFDLEAQDEQIWESTSQAHITVEYTLKSTPAADYRIHAILDVDRKIQLQGINKKLAIVQ